MTFFKSILNFGKQALGLGKNGSKSNLGGFMKRAGSFISNGLRTLNSSPVKGLISSVSNYLPQIGEAYSGLKKYGNIANSVLNGGAIERKGERIMKRSPLHGSMDRLGHVAVPSHFDDYDKPRGRFDKNSSRRDRQEPSIEKTRRNKYTDQKEDWLGDSNDDAREYMQMQF